MTQHHISEDPNPLQDCCGNVRSEQFCSFWSTDLTDISPETQQYCSHYHCQNSLGLVSESTFNVKEIYVNWKVTVLVWQTELEVAIGKEFFLQTDYMSTLEKDFDYRDEHFDFMQQWVRRFCLQYGAALFYTSAKEDKNCDLLYKYLTYRIYGFPFRTPALVVEKDAVLM